MHMIASSCLRQLFLAFVFLISVRLCRTTAASKKGARGRLKTNLLSPGGTYRALFSTGAAIELAQSPPRKRGGPLKPDQPVITLFWRLLAREPKFGTLQSKWGKLAELQ